MKAELTGRGCIILTPENGTEEFALWKWWENFNGGDNSSALSIKREKEEEDENEPQI